MTEREFKPTFLRPGLGLAVVARIVEQLGGQLRVDSKVNEGSRFSFLIPLALPLEVDIKSALLSFGRPDNSPSESIRIPTRRSSQSSEIDGLVEALTFNHMSGVSGNSSPKDGSRNFIEDVTGIFKLPLRRGSSPAVSEDHLSHTGANKDDPDTTITRRLQPPMSLMQPLVSHDVDATKLRILIVEVRAIILRQHSG